MSFELRDTDPGQRSVQLHAQWFHQLDRSANGAIFLFDPYGIIEYASSPVETLLGCDNQSLLGRSLYDHVHVEDQGALADAVANSIAQKGQSTHISCRLICKDGSWIHVEGVAVGHVGEDQAAHCLLSTWDVTERRRTEALVRKRAQWFQALTRNSRDVITVFGDGDECLFVSGSAQTVLGHDPDEMSWFVFTAAIHDSDRDRVMSAFAHCRMHPGGSLTVEYRRRRTDGRYIHVESHAVNKSGDPDVKGLIIYTHDISERIGRDPLTSLPNRTALAEIVEARLQTDSRLRDVRFALLVLKLDRLSEVESGLGYQLADELILQLKQRLLDSLRAGEIVARLKRDQFAVLIPNIPVGEDVQQTAVRIRELIEVPFTLGEHQLVTTVRAGIATGTADSYDSPDAVLRAANAALQVAHQAAGGQACYQTGMFHSIEDRLHLEHELREALDDEALELHYQPIVDLKSRRIVAFEALLRWLHPTRGYVNPERIIEIALQTGLMGRLGEWVLQQACCALASWKRRSPAARDLVVNVNLAAEQLNGDLCGLVDGILRGARLHPRYLKLEVTETSIIANPDAAANTLALLKARGIGLSLDDFGTGYSSLSYLHRFPFDAIKIDRSFVKDIGTDIDSSKHAALIRTIVAMGESLDTCIVAEGIQTQEQLELLTEMGCGQGQGYFFSRPVPARVSEDLLSRAEPWSGT